LLVSEDLRHQVYTDAGMRPVPCALFLKIRGR